MIIDKLDIDGSVYDLPSGASAIVDGDNLIINNGNAIDTQIHLANFEYSEEERIVGCWIDGKPIYEKTIKFQGNNIKFSDVDSLINVSQCFAITANGRSYYLPRDNVQDINDSISLQVSNLEVRLYPGSNYRGEWAIVETVITIQYTKSTDLPNSFKPSMLNIKSIAPQHNYSTEETVVGTWIDGKTVYEKVINIDFAIDTSPQCGYDYTEGMADITKIIKQEGFFEYYDGLVPMGSFYEPTDTYTCVFWQFVPKQRINFQIGFKLRETLVYQGKHLTGFVIIQYLKD